MSSDIVCDRVGMYDTLNLSEISSDERSPRLNRSSICARAVRLEILFVEFGGRAMPYAFGKKGIHIYLTVKRRLEHHRA
jgi:hypothetical protein